MVSPLEHSILNLPGEPRMLDAVRAGLAGAEEALLAVSFTRCSGLQLLVDPIQEVARRGRVRILTSTYQQVTQPEALETLLGMKGVECRVQEGATGFHAKFWWFQGQHGAECWAGSSNLTKGGLATNLEWNLRSLERARIEQTRRQFDGLWARPDVRPLSRELIHHYRLRRRPEVALPPLSWVADAQAPAPEPNGAQLEALVKLAALRERGERRAAVIAATGLGKTFLAAFDVDRCQAQRVLYVSHRLEHLTQAFKAFGQVLQGRRSLGLLGGGRAEVDADILFATVQSLRGHDALLARPWDYVIIDEFHHAEAPGYQPLRKTLDKAFLLGMTATPERQDGHDVLEWCNWNIAYEMRLPEAIERRWLVPFHYFGIADETVEFSRIPWRNGRIPIDVLERELSIDARAELVLEQALLHGFDGPKRATVGFCASVRHAEFMAEAFRKRRQTAVAVSGQQPVEERERIYRRLADVRDPLEWLFVADVLNEGVDIPAINSLLFLRPTESASLFLQQLGRGLRLYEGTEVLTVLDFVGHHRSAWVTLQALHDPKGTGGRVDVVEGFTLKPPRDCEVVLQQRTREILAKIRRLTTRQRCDEAYRLLRDELGRPPLPVDLWHREELPELKDFRTAYGSWLECQRAQGDTPAWAQGLPEEHPVRSLLAAAELDWQASRVGVYALLWGLAARPDDPRAGYEAFFRAYPQWREEHAALEPSRSLEDLLRKVPAGVVMGEQLVRAIPAVLGQALLAEVEGRLLYTVNKDFLERHGGVLRTPADLARYAQYTRPEIVRHFGKQYDPARHNVGMLWFDQWGVIVTKLDTSGAKETQRYRNRFVSDRRFSWTSQNKMGPRNELGRKVLEHEARGSTLYLFVQARSHEPALYMGEARVVGVEGSEPMTVTFELDRPVPPDVQREFDGAFPPPERERV